MTPVHLGPRIRAARVALGLSQRALAERAGISPSYLNLIEADRRPVTTDLLLKLARLLDLDLRALGNDDAELVTAITDLASDPLFEDIPVTAAEIRQFVASQPNVARMLRQLYSHHLDGQTSLETLKGHLLAEDHDHGVGSARLASEQVSDFFERHDNYFPTMETAADALWQDAGLEEDTLFAQLKTFAQRELGVAVALRPPAEMRGAVRRFDPNRRELLLSDGQPGAGRTFQLAAQIGLIRSAAAIDRLVDDPSLRAQGARELCRSALASYFAAAVVMPYDTFLTAAEAARYDVEQLSRRFGGGWEQTCHRLTTLRKPGAEGVSFYLLRVDMAGNISKRFSAAGVRFPRFSGLCALWNVHAAFAQPGRVRVQLSALPDSQPVLSIARTVRRDGPYHAPEILHSVGIGCSLAEARRTVYADVVKLEDKDAVVPIGFTCRLCERLDCAARAFPSLRAPLNVDANVRGLPFFIAKDEPAD
jgi:predicted transcriptional regulator/DNA-binding XRE family transcriptional regulator